MKKILQTPIKDRDIEKMAMGDIIYLNGLLITSRDDVHHRLIKQKKQLPVNLKGMAVFHAGPIMQKIDEHSYKVVSIGPTTSMRMEKYTPEFIQATGVKVIIGKGGMGPRTAKGCQKYRAIHAVFPGGCAVLAAEQIERVERVEWLDLGMPEAIWVMRVKEFGPLIVSIDTQGNNLFEENKKKFDQRKAEAIAKINRHVDFLQ